MSSSPGSDGTVGVLSEGVFVPPEEGVFVPPEEGVFVPPDEGVLAFGALPDPADEPRIGKPPPPPPPPPPQAVMESTRQAKRADALPLLISIQNSSMFFFALSVLWTAGAIGTISRTGSSQKWARRPGGRG
jgi:hypothetical protein